EQSGDLAGLVHVDALGGGHLGQSGHGHDLTGQGYQEASAGGDLHVPNGNGEAAGSAQLGLVVAAGGLGLGHAAGHLVVAQLGQSLDLLLSIGGEVHAVAVVDLLNDGFDLLLDGQIQLVSEGEVVGLFAQTDNFLSQSDTAFAALAPNFGQSHVDA